MSLRTSSLRGPALAAIVLAAGRSARMGQPKVLLELGGRTLIEQHVARLRELGVSAIVVVVRPELEREVRRALGEGAITLVSRETGSQAESLAAALRVIFAKRAPNPEDALLITPVDLLPPRLSTLQALVEALVDPAVAVTPVHRGRGGHPVIARALALLAIAAPLRPLRDLLSELGPRRVRLEVDDPRVLGDFDSPEDLPNRAEAWTPKG